MVHQRRLGGFEPLMHLVAVVVVVAPVTSSTWASLEAVWMLWMAYSKFLLVGCEDCKSIASSL